MLWLTVGGSIVNAEATSSDFVAQLDMSVPLGAQFRFIHSTADTNGEYEQAEAVQLAHTDGPPLHMHPWQEETFDIVSGTLDLFIDGKWREFGAHATVTVPKRKPHTLKNGHDDDVRFRVTLRPGGDFEGMMRTFCNLIKAGKLRDTKSLRALIYMSMVFAEHRNDVVLVRPPNVLVSVLAGVGRLIGFELR